MDFPSKGELIANHHANEEEIGKSLGVDSLKYLSVKKLLESVPHKDKAGKEIGYCTACFTGNYPVPFDDETQENDD